MYPSSRDRKRPSRRERGPIGAARPLNPNRSSGRRAAAQLTRLASGLVEDEVRLRVGTAMRPITIRFGLASQADAEGGIENAHKELDAEIGRAGGQQRLNAAINDATEAVKQITNERRELESFRGKTVLHRFYDQHAKQGSFSYMVFAYQLARLVKDTQGSEHFSDLDHASAFWPRRKIVAPSGSSGRSPKSSIRSARPSSRGTRGTKPSRRSLEMSATRR